MTIMDDYSRFAEIVLLKRKSDAAQAFVYVAKQYERQTGNLVQRIRFDRGTEFKGELRKWMYQEGVVAEPSPPDTPQSNGRAERLNKTLIQRTRAMLLHFDLPDSLWEYAMEAATYTRNRVVSVNETKTPFELFYGQKPPIDHLRVFGCTAHVLVPSNQRAKFDSVSQRGIFVGYLRHSRAWKVLVDNRGLVVRDSCNVKFIEDQTNDALRKVLRENPDADVKDLGTEYVDIILPDAKRPAPATSSDLTEDLLGGDSGDDASDANDGEEHASREETQDDAPEEGAEERRYPLRHRRAPTGRNPYEGYVNMASELMTLPGTIQEAKSRPDWPLWREAINDELRSVYEKGVYSDMSVLDVPTDKKPIPSKWVFDYKTDENGNVVRYKARLVAKGFHQVQGIDFGETFAPTVQVATIRFLLAHAAEQNYQIHQVDVKTAFLNGELEEEVYVKVPPGINAEGRIWRLHKALYGLKQAAKAWYDKWTEALAALNFAPAKADPCLFIRTEGSPVFLILYVDDVLVFGAIEDIKPVVKSVKETFEVKDMGLLVQDETKKFLGMELKRVSTPDFVGVILQQNRYTLALLKRFGLENANSVPTPMNPGTKLKKDGC